MMQQLHEWYQAKCLNEEGKLREGIKWVLRGAGLIALGSLLTSCGNWRMYEHPGANKFREVEVDVREYTQTVPLLDGYEAENTFVRDDVRDFISEYLAAASKRHHINLYHPSTADRVQDPLTYSVAEKVIYFIDTQLKEADGTITKREVQEAQKNIDDLLK